MKSTARNTFVAEMDVCLPENDKQALNRWLNFQHTGKELIPFTEKVSEELKEATYTLYRGRKYRMKFEINKNGDWKFIKVL